MPKYGNYCCPDCGCILREHPVDFGTTFPDGAPLCPQCDHPNGGGRWVKMEWLPQIGRMSAGNGPTFTAFETTGPDGKLTRINSITELRTMERESEKMAKDGVPGAQQMVWRDYANGISNKDEHAIHKIWEANDYPGMPTKEARASFRALTQQEGEARAKEVRATESAASPTE